MITVSHGQIGYSRWDAC